MSDLQQRLPSARLKPGVTRWLVPLLPLAALGVGAAAPGRAFAREELFLAPPPVAESVARPDSEVNLWLTRATAAVQAGRPDEALPLLLRLLQAPPAALATTNGVTYVPARTLALALLRSLPEKSRAAYRRTAEAPSGRAVDRISSPAELAALEEWCRTALPGTASAEAGRVLAGFQLDQGRFGEARALLVRLLEECEPEGALRAELLARLVVAAARLGDGAQAERAWGELRKDDAAGRWAFLAAELRAAPPPAPPVSHAWTMAYGGPAREGAAPEAAPPEAETIPAWALCWGVDLGPGLVRSGVDGANPTNLPPLLSTSRDHARQRMTASHLRPSDDLAFDASRAWVNLFGACVTLDLAAGRPARRMAQAADDPALTALAAMDGAWVFDNRLGRAISLIGAACYCVEDNYRSMFRAGALEQRVWDGKRYVYRTVPSGNALAAYDAETGRLRWRIGRTPPPADAPDRAADGWQVNAVRFAAAPVACGERLVVPVEESAGVALVGLDPERGALAWLTRLAAGFPSVRPRAAVMNVTVADGTAYIVTGNGCISALDGYEGSVRWTALYPRAAGYIPVDAAWRDRKREGTWEESLLLIAGDTVVALPEDSAEILALDRRTGARLWTAPKPDGVEYVVGRRGSSLIAAGRRAAVCIDLTDGRERWRTPLEGSTGRGTLLGRQVLFPCDQQILRLGAADGAPLAPARVQTMEGLPLGNLYVNGSRLLVAGLERVYALEDARPVFSRLADDLKQQPAAATYAARGALYAALGQALEAVADLREAWQRQRGLPGEAAARAALLSACWQAARQNPAATEALCAEARGVAVTAAEQAECIWRWGQCRERAGDTNGALTLYASALVAPDQPLAPSGYEKDWEASAHRLAAQRIQALLAGPAAGLPRPGEKEADGWALLEEPAAAAGRAADQAGWAALVDLATFLPGTRAGTEAARRAVQRAAATGDFGMAEALLQRILARTTPAHRVVLARSLVQLYGEMKWPEGVRQLRTDWSWLGGGTPLPEFLTPPAVTPATALAPPPPWRLRWRARLPPRTSMQSVPAGLYYYSGGTNPVTGCLDLESGRVRWQTNRVFGLMPGGETDWSERHLQRVFTGDAGGCVDVWSGRLMTHALFQAPYEWVHDRGGHDREPMSVSRAGLATVRYTMSDMHLAGVDLLTGELLWRRGDADALLVWWTPSVQEPATRLYLMNHRAEDGGRLATELDLWTGATPARRAFDPGGYGRWLARMTGRAGRDDPDALHRGPPECVDRRLVVRDQRTGATFWRSPPELPVTTYTVLPGGTVAACTGTDQWTLLSGEDGRVQSSFTAPASIFCRLSRSGNHLIALDEAQLGTNHVLMLEMAAGRVAFQGKLPKTLTPLAPCAAPLTNALLATLSIPAGASQVAVNPRGEPLGAWRLPRREDLRPGASAAYAPVVLDGVILLTDYATGEVLAYEHDPDASQPSPAAPPTP